MKRLYKRLWIFLAVSIMATSMAAQGQVNGASWLTSLTVDNAVLSPAFSPTVADYTASGLELDQLVVRTKETTGTVRMSLNGGTFESRRIGSFNVTRLENLVEIELTKGGVVSMYRIRVTKGPLAGITPTVSDTTSVSGFRIGHQSTLLTDGRVLVSGGYPIAAASGAVKLYDPETNTWTDAASMISRGDHSQTLLPDGRVLVVGGKSSALDSWAVITLNTQIYDPETDVWTSVDNPSYSRWGHHAICLKDGRVLVFGGSVFGGWSTSEIFDPSTGKWSITGNMQNSLRAYSAAVMLEDGRILATGGAGGSPHRFCEIYDPTTGQWKAVASMKYDRSSHTASLLPDGRVLVVGGLENSAISDGHAEIYDPDTDVWQLTALMTHTRIFHTATVLPDGRVIVIGGFLYDVSGTNKWRWWSETFNPTTNRWDDHHLAHGNVLSGGINFQEANPSNHTATLTKDGRVLVVGERDFPASASLSSSAKLVSFAPHLISVGEGSKVLQEGSELDFDHVTIGESLTKTLTLTNSTDQDITLSPVILQGEHQAQFSTGGPGVTLLAPGEETSLTVSFSSTGRGSREATLYIGAQADSDPSAFVIHLAGSGVTGYPGYQTWSEDYGEVRSEPEESHHLDGVANILKYAFNIPADRSSPSTLSSGGTSGLPSVKLVSGESRLLRLEYLRRKESGLIYTPQYGVALIDFAPMTALPKVTSINSDWERVVVEQPISSPTAFARVKVELPLE